jgi:hypothetical protein
MAHTRKRTIGSRAEVWHGTCEKTVSGLRKKDLMKHKGRIVSRKKHAQGLKSIRRLRALGFVTKKGSFTLFKRDSARHTRRHTRRGGAAGIPSAHLMGASGEAVAPRN